VSRPCAACRNTTLTSEAAARLFVALDVETLAEAEALLDRLGELAPGVKIGNQLFTAAGPGAVERAHTRGARVFLDLKYHDIPNTVAGAVRQATRLGVFMLNVHASGGVAMMRAAAAAAAKAASDFAVARPIVLAVTVLTSLDRKALQDDLGVAATVESHVLRLAERAREAGLDGCVASPHEIGLLRRAMGASWTIVTPGIRPVDRADDQARVATPAAAIRAGADYLVVGRPITAAADPAAALRAIVAEIGGDRPPSPTATALTRTP
jgi:orotidine-5'-phosphate decarboxylase